MKHRATPEFWRRYRALPEEVRRAADKQYHLLRSNPNWDTFGEFEPLYGCPLYGDLEAEEEAEVVAA